MVECVKKIQQIFRGSNSVANTLAPIGVAKPLGIHFWDDAPDVVNHLFVNDLCRVSLLRLIVP